PTWSIVSANGETANDPAEVPVPPVGVLTATGPVAVFGATITVSFVADTTWKLQASVPPTMTAVAPRRFLPATVTVVPGWPLVGLKLEIVAEGVTVKLVALVTVPPGAATEILPDVAPTGTVATSCVSELIVK